MTLTLPGFANLLKTPTAYKPPAAPAIPAGDEDKVGKVADHFNKADYEIADGEGLQSRSRLSEREMMFLSHETITRFLTATKGDVYAAITRLENAIIWRRTEKVEDVEAMAADCGSESATGKNMLLGYTKQGRPVIYFFPHRNTTPVEKRRAVHAVFMLERAADLMPEGVSFTGKKQGPPTSVTVARQVLHILSAHYPERLSYSYFLDMPFIVRTFVTLMWPFVDPATKKKVKFENDIIKDGQMDSDQLLKECGGTLELPYEHDAYWPILIKLCLDRRAAQEAAFRSLGEAKAGRSESLFKRISPASTVTNGHTTSSAAPEADRDTLGID